MNNQYSKLLQSDEDVNKRISEIAKTIISKYSGQNPLFVCLLRGGAPFAGKLMFEIVSQDTSFNPELDYITLRTYADKRHSKTPELVMGLSPRTVVEGRPVILLDDVLDHGYTAAFASSYVVELGASRADLVVLVQKIRDRPIYQTASIYGFEAPADWLTGMGMDDPRIAREANRWLGAVAVAKDPDQPEAPAA